MTRPARNIAHDLTGSKLPAHTSEISTRWMLTHLWHASPSFPASARSRGCRSNSAKGVSFTLPRVESGRSRWRDTPTLQLHYDVSRLPFRGVLYDEVKSLTDTLCLGMGGLNYEVGDLFFFLLEAR